MKRMLTEHICTNCRCNIHVYNYLQSALNRHHKVVQVALAVVEALQRTAKQSADISRDTGWEDCAITEKLQLSALQVLAVTYSIIHCLQYLRCSLLIALSVSKQVALRCD
jgi:imidazoleglycerol phosphate dehydratase HisB